MVYTSGIAAAEYLKKYRPKERVYALATDEMKADLAARGVPLDEENPDVCLLAYDTSLTFAKMKKFNEFLCAGKFYAATHPDAVCPALPCPMPDVGSFIEMFRVSSGRTPDVVCGKPCPVMGEGLESLLGVEKGEVAMVGDRLHTDIRFANCSGFTAVLVLSGGDDGGDGGGVRRPPRHRFEGVRQSSAPARGGKFGKKRLKNPPFCGTYIVDREDYA